MRGEFRFPGHYTPGKIDPGKQNCKYPFIELFFITRLILQQAGQAKKCIFDFYRWNISTFSFTGFIARGRTVETVNII